MILLVTGAVSVTKTYLAKQEERRRLEAEAAERAQHPLYYGDLITLYAAEQSLDPALVSAVILCESSIDPRAESRLGARGLMQLMPDTAEWVAHKYKEDGAATRSTSSTTRKPTSATARGIWGISPAGLTAMHQDRLRLPRRSGPTWTVG